MINITRTNIYLFSFFLLFFDAVLRLEQKSGVTLDRIFFIIPIFVILIYDTKIYLKFMFLYITFFLYNFYLSLLYGANTYFLQMSVHYFIIGNILLIILILIRDSKLKKLIILLTYVLFLIVLICYSQMFFGFYLPNVEIYPNGEVQAFFRIHNDMGVALMAGLPIFILYLSKYNRRYKIFKFIIFLSLIFYISYINDTKTALLSILIFLFIFVFNYFLLSHKVIIKLFTLIVICIVSVSSVLIAYKYNPTLKFANETVHINELILDPVIRIVNLDMYPMDSWGSVENRVNALIIALKVYANSYMIGIGYGNSVSVLSLPEYELKAAKSMHNDVIVWLLEFGILVFCIYLLFIIKIFILFFKSYSLINNIRISIFFSFPIGILSSSGVTSNYYFIICLFTLLFYKENNENIIYNR